MSCLVFYVFETLSASVVTVIRMFEWLALPTLEHKVPGLNPAESRIQLLTVQHFVAQSLSLSPFHVERDVNHEVRAQLFKTNDVS